MSRVIEFFFLGCVVSLFSQGCLKRGCTDPAALDYDPEARRDNRKCTYGDRYADQKREFMDTYADLAYAMYSDAASAAVMFELSLNEFASAPTQNKLNKCRTDWQKTMSAWALCDVLRYADGPVDSKGYNHQTAAWPINPGYIDYTTSQPYAGIVQDTGRVPKINETVLKELMGTEGSSSVSLGLHVIEFLLWGEDTAAPYELSSGNRPLSDFTTDFFAARRLAYLKAAAKSLATSMNHLAREWEDVEKGNYRRQFVHQPINTALRQILSGMATLADADIAERQLRQAVLIKNDVRERCRFSDYSTKCIQRSVLGVQTVYLGAFVNSDGIKVSGYSLSDLIEDADASANDSLDQSLKETINYVGLISGYFDNQMLQETWPGDGPMEAAYNELKRVVARLKKTGESLGVGVRSSLP